MSETILAARAAQTTLNVPDTLSEIARMIERDWKHIYFGARPYIDAMYTLSGVSDSYGCESASSIINYFLVNAATWRGQTAKAVKAKLRKMIK